MKRHAGFALIEAVIFIIVTGILLSTVFMSSMVALRNAPSVHQQWIALQTARQCMEWFLGQRRLNGYTALTCPSTPSSTACVAPSGFSVSTSVTCTTWNSDAAYKIITVSVNGLASASLTAQIGDD